MKAKKTLIVIGDRVLVELDESKERTATGLYLPPTVKEKEKVHGGYIVKVGPGYPVSDPNAIAEEPWAATRKNEVKFIPLQAHEGDYAIFLKDAAVEIEFESKKYLIVPHSAILALVRTEIAAEDFGPNYD
jgi:co-chaperonin GroES (HSP10)